MCNVLYHHLCMASSNHDQCAQEPDGIKCSNHSLFSKRVDDGRMAELEEALLRWQEEKKRQIEKDNGEQKLKRDRERRKRHRIEVKRAAKRKRQKTVKT